MNILYICLYVTFYLVLILNKIANQMPPSELSLFTKLITANHSRSPRRLSFPTRLAKSSSTAPFVWTPSRRQGGQRLEWDPIRPIINGRFS